MKTQPGIPVGLVALTYALVLLSGDVVAQSGHPREVCIPNRIGDGHCDKSQNNEACGYDGGDCCECTCTSGPKFACSSSDFACADPSASCTEDVGIAPAVVIECSPDLFADGDCNPGNNNEECGYDSGDCCECTCVSTPSFTCGEATHGGFECVDPSAPCVPDEVDVDDDDSVVSYPSSPSSYTGDTASSSCVPVYIADGDCDFFNNNEACGYDGGDCCGCTCVSTPTFTCGDEEFGGFACLDPGAPCVEDDDFTSLPQDDTYYSSYTSSSACVADYFSDGDCDLFNNNEECGYDGGDCCQCTCVTTDSFTCGDGSHGGFSCLDPSAPCVDDDDVTTLPSSESFTYTGSSTSLSCVPDYFSDGLCDRNNNNEDCGYDGGDCCECTCVTTESFTCGDEEFGGFACLDPSAPCVDDDDFTPLPPTNTTTSSDFTTSAGCIPSYFGDAYCDQTNNNENCGYDGGDCCECTCINTRDISCGDESFGGFACVDPSAPCVDDDDVTTVPSSDTFSDTFTYTGTSTSLSCVPDYFSDGLCDQKNNNEVCGYDGGDCCECTCVSTETFTCGDEEFGGFACLDPSAPCVDDDDFIPVPPTNTTTSSDFTTSLDCIPSYFGDAYCDLTNNNELCGYDGGDCCQCTCISTRDFICGEEAQGFACLDPSAPCVDDDDVTVLPEDDSITPYTSYSSYTSSSGSYTSTFSCVPGYFADGDCDPANNRKECGFDGGDCCQCTCVDDAFTCGDDSHGGYDCIDPDAPCADDDDDIISLESSTSLFCIPGYVSDGLCDQNNNNEGCGYDGGDCCECTCVDSYYTCGDAATGSGGFVCLDPSAPCFEDGDESPTSLCLGDIVSNGMCDPDNNNEECGYDGGDCCECTCTSTPDFTCGENGGFDCIDPDSSCEEEGLVEAGTKTTIGVSTNTYDPRVGEAFGGMGCGENGCGPELTRDGSVDEESRWACAQKLDPDAGVCEIEFAFEDPQDIMDVQVAFWKADERARTLQAMVNGEVVGEFDSSPATPFTSLGIQGVGVETMTFKTVGLTENDWIGLVEVRFMVEP